MKQARRQILKRGLLGGALILGVGGGYYRQRSKGALQRGLDKFEDWFRRTEAQDPNGSTEEDIYFQDAPIPNESEYRTFLKGLKLRHFSPSEIIRPHRNYRNGVRNNIPPKELWEEVSATLIVADELRERLRAKANVMSVYRSVAYNTAIGGASRSQHMRNKAIDISFECSSDEAFEMAKLMREEGLFTGGIGWYPSFIHIDTRGYQATWGKV